MITWTSKEWTSQSIRAFIYHLLIDVFRKWSYCNWFFEFNTWWFMWWFVGRWRFLNSSICTECVAVAENFKWCVVCSKTYWGEKPGDEGDFTSRSIIYIGWWSYLVDMKNDWMWYGFHCLIIITTKRKRKEKSSFLNKFGSTKLFSPVSLSREMWSVHMET